MDMNNERRQEARPVTVTVDWVGGESEDREKFLSSLGLDRERWQESQIARIASNTQFKIFGMELQPREPYAGAPEWKCRVGKLPMGGMGFTINGALVAASLSGVFGDRADLNPGRELLRSIQALSLKTGSAVVPVWLSELGRLELLRLHGCEFLTDISVLGGLTGLTSLDLRFCSSLTAISNLGGLASLTSLDLCGCRSLTDISVLGELTGLTNLNLSSCESLTDISGLGKLTGLTSLDLCGCRSLTDISVLGGLSGLTSLDLSGCKSLTDISGLGGSTGLTSLDLSWCRSLTDISVLGGLTSLTSLDLRGCESLTDISVLGGLTGLTELNLNWCESLTDISGLGSLTNLTSLDLSRWETLKDISGLGGLSGLTSLDLSRCGSLTDISGLGSLTSLTSLDLSRCETLKDISGLGSLTSLTSLNLSGSRSLTDISVLGGLTSLTSLDLNWCNFLEDISGLKGLTSLTSLELSGCTYLKDISGLKGLTGLTSLDLSSCESLTDVQAVGTLYKLNTLNIDACQYLDSTRLEPLWRLSHLKDLGLKMPSLRLRILLHAAHTRVDRSRMLDLLVGDPSSDSNGSLDILANSSDPDLVSRIAAGISLVGSDPQAGFVEQFLNLSLPISSLRCETWFQILQDVACGCPGALAAWFSGLSEKEALPAAFISGLLQFVAEERRLDDLVWSPLLDALLEKVSKADQIELGPQICLAWRVLGESGKVAEWLKRLTTPESGGFADKVLVQFALHDIRKGDMVSATKLLGRFEKGDSGDADTVRRALARTLAATAPEDAGEHLAGVYDEADRKALAGELMAVPGFTQVEANLSRLITILGTDPDRFHRLVDLMLTQNPDSQWVEELRCQLSPPDDRGIAEVLVAILSRPEVRQRTKEKKLEALQSKLLQDSGWVKRVLESTAILLLKSEGLVDAGEAAELRALITPKGEKEFI